MKILTIIFYPIKPPTAQIMQSVARNNTVNCTKADKTQLCKYYYYYYYY